MPGPAGLEMYDTWPQLVWSITPLPSFGIALRAGIWEVCGAGGRQGGQEVGRGSWLSPASRQPGTGTGEQPAGRDPAARERVEPARHLGFGARYSTSPALPGPRLSVAPSAKVSLQPGSVHPRLCDAPVQLLPACRVLGKAGLP